MTVERSTELSAIATAAAAKAEVEAAYIMALKKPRNEDDARVKIVALCQNPSFAQKAKYRKPVGRQKNERTGQWEDKEVTGPSIRMIEQVLRLWGNVLVQQGTIYDDDTRRVAKVIVRDLENNLAYSTEIPMEKAVERSSNKDRLVLGSRTNSKGYTTYVVRATEEEAAIKQAAQASKHIRNNGARLIPQHILDEALAAVEQTLLSKAKADPEGERKRLLDAFGQKGVLPSDLEKYLGHPVAQLTPKELVDLRDVLNAIEEGSATWADFVGEGDQLAPGQDAATPSPQDKGAAVRQRMAAARNTPEPTQPESLTEAPTTTRDGIPGYLGPHVFAIRQAATMDELQDRMRTAMKAQKWSKADADALNREFATRQRDLREAVGQ